MVYPYIYTCHICVYFIGSADDLRMDFRYMMGIFWNAPAQAEMSQHNFRTGSIVPKLLLLGVSPNITRYHQSNHTSFSCPFLDVFGSPSGCGLPKKRSPNICTSGHLPSCQALPRRNSKTGCSRFSGDLELSPGTTNKPLIW